MNDINRWQKAISSLPDKQFFNIIRLYLGEIKTPYNKQRLIEQLASFIRNTENTQAIINLLDQFDIQVLTAISLIPKPTIETLINFFSGSYSYSDIYSEVLNLKDRLIIYSEKEDFTEKEHLFLNPLIEEKIRPFLDIKIILQNPTTCFYSMDDIFQLSPNFIASFISYIKIHGIVCKSDGIIKKNDQNRLEEIFPGKSKCLQLLMNAFINLSLVRENQKGFLIDNTRLSVFAQLPENQQTAFLCAASTSRFSTEGLKKEAQLLLDCLSSIPETGFTRKTILQLSFLIGTYTEDGSAIARKSRFSQMLEAARGSAEINPEQNANLLDRMIDSAIEFGLLRILGKDENGNEIFVPGEMIQSPQSIEEKKNLLHIDSTFTVTLLPGLNLKTLLPLTSFLMIKKSAVVTEFEFSKKSVSQSFDEGWTPETIFKELSKFTSYEIPENLCINITEWYSAYASAMIYHGYVLKVEDANIPFVENNPNIKKYIKEKLAHGIYFLNIPANEEINAFLDESGLDFLGKMREATTQNEYYKYPSLQPGHALKMQNQTETTEKICIAKGEEILKNLKQQLDKQDFEKNKKENLAHRISNRLILSEKQLLTAAVRTEILEADGMDFSGKVHLIDAAIKEETLMELQLPDATGNGTFFTLLAKPLQISKQLDEAVCRFQIEPEHQIETILVSRITYLRWLRY